MNQDNKKIENKQKIRDLLVFFGMNNKFLNKRKNIIANNLKKSFENFLYIAERFYYDDFYTYTNLMVDEEKKFYQIQYEKYFLEDLKWTKKDIKNFNIFIKKRNSDNFLKISRKNRISGYYYSLKIDRDTAEGKKKLKKEIRFLKMIVILVPIIGLILLIFIFVWFNI